MRLRDCDGGLDLRTREGREAEVLDWVRRHDGYSVFWASENRARARAVDRLEASGRIVRRPGGIYPWVDASVVDLTTDTPSEGNG